jgi:methionyl-tRNA formyltransferase
MNCEELWNEIGEKSPQMIEQTLLEIKNGTLKPEKQCDDGVCMAPKLTKEECLIDWSKSNTDIHNLVRGVCRSPGAYFIFNNKIIKVIETEKIDGSGVQGKIAAHSKDGVDMGCGKGLVRLITVKPEGKGEMKASDWYNGVRK